MNDNTDKNATQDKEELHLALAGDILKLADGVDMKVLWKAAREVHFVLLMTGTDTSLSQIASLLGQECELMMERLRERGRQ